MVESNFRNFTRLPQKNILFPDFNFNEQRIRNRFNLYNQNSSIQNFIAQRIKSYDEHYFPPNHLTNNYGCTRYGTISPEHILLANKITSFLAMNDPNMDIRSQDVVENWRQFHQAAITNNLNPVALASFHTLSLDGTSKTVKKNATRENSSTLKFWLQEHKNNPYPSKGEKILLAILTQMTLTQVSTWFANARRRLKKEKKIQWPLIEKYDKEDSGSESVSVDQHMSELSQPTDTVEKVPLKKHIWSIIDMISKPEEKTSPKE